MRISKELSQSIAKKLTEKSKLAMEALKKEYQKCVTDLYKAQMPDEISTAFQNHPEWFCTKRTIGFNGNGFRYEQVIAVEPVICNGYGSANLKVNGKIADVITKHKRKFENAEEKYKNLLSETEMALMALKTYKNIEANIPAAKPFLPPPMSNALVCNFDSLNRKINSQPEVAKEVVTGS